MEIAHAGVKKSLPKKQCFLGVVAQPHVLDLTDYAFGQVKSCSQLDCGEKNHES